MRFLKTLFIVLFLAGAARSGTVQESFTAGNDAGVGGAHGFFVGDGGVDRFCAQSFTLGSDIECDQVQLEFSGDVVGTMNGQTTLAVETDSSGSPSGSLVHADMTDSFADQPAAGYHGDAFTAHTLTGSTLYWITAKTTNTAPNTSVSRFMAEDDADGYADGSAKWQDNGGAWSAQNYDINFKVYGTAAAAASGVTSDGVSGSGTGPMMIYRFDSKTGKEQIVAYHGKKKTAKEAFEELEAEGKL